MMLRNWQKDISLLNIGRIIQYLRGTGWEEKPSRRENIGIFYRQQNGIIFEILIPLDHIYDDYYEALINAVIKISDFEKKSPDHIFQRLILPPTDILSFRINTPFTNSGTVSLKNGIRILNTTKKLLLSAASDVENPQPFHQRTGYRKTTSMVDSCRLGQTEKGSFIVNIHCPVDDNADYRGSLSNQSLEQQPESSQDYSFARQVTSQLMNGIKLLDEWYNIGELSRLEDRQGNILISSNFIDSLIELHPNEDDSELEISLKGSPLVPIANSIPTSLSLNSNWIPDLRSFSNSLKTSTAIFSGQFVGKVAQLKAKPNIEERTDGEILFSTIFNDQPITVHINLSPLLYKLAGEAHLAGDQIICEGRLKRVGNRKEIEQTRFELIDH